MPPDLPQFSRPAALALLLVLVAIATPESLWVAGPTLLLAIATAGLLGYLVQALLRRPASYFVDLGLCLLLVVQATDTLLPLWLGVPVLLSLIRQRHGRRATLLAMLPSLLALVLISDAPPLSSPSILIPLLATFVAPFYFQFKTTT